MEPISTDHLIADFRTSRDRLVTRLEQECKTIGQIASIVNMSLSDIATRSANRERVLRNVSAK